MELTDYIKYCLGYIKLTRQKALSAQQKHSVVIPKDHFNLLGLLNGDLDGSLAEPIVLPTFFSLDPKNIPEDRKGDYEKEKQLANKIEEIYNAQRNDQFTKQIALSFGHFELELPLLPEEDVAQDGIDEAFTPQSFDNGNSVPLTGDLVRPLEAAQEQVPPRKSKIERYPLFTLPILIEKKIQGGVGRYLVFAVDPEIQVNVAVLEPILGSNLYFQLIRELGEYERQDRLSLPFKDSETFVEIWQKVKAQLKLCEAVFDEQSFQLNELRIALTTRANYFLAEDLQRLSQLDAEKLKGTALACWTEDVGLNEESAIPEERELYFPFKYDKYQLRTLTLLSNKAAIIQGPPGTGKSETISNLLCHLAATGKKVLFVSQKAQALKVVKDRLRSLKVNYLFGYLPNPGSSQLGELDEEDGIAPQLTALKSHIESVGNRHGERSLTTLEEVVQSTHARRQSLNRIVDHQRKHWALYQEAQALREFSLPVSDWNRFVQHCTTEQWDRLLLLKVRIFNMEKEIERYEAEGTTFPDHPDFECIDWTRGDYSASVQEIYQDVVERGYDGSSHFLRSTVNSIRKIRYVTTRSKLPREFRDFIDWTLNQDVSRSQAAAEIKTLLAHTQYKHNCAALDQLQVEFRKLIAGMGLTSEACGSLEKLTNHNSHDFETTKHKILRLHEVQDGLQELDLSGKCSDIRNHLKQLTQDRTKVVAGYLQRLIDKKILATWKAGRKIKSLVEILAKAFGKSKKAFKTFDKIRQDPENFLTIHELIPVWIMELDDASRIIPLEPKVFDYVILDEASQCNIAYTLPVMFRTRHAIFVGDSEQMKDSTIMFKSNRAFDELAHKYQIPDELQIKATGTSVQSVLDIAALRGLMSVPLRYHYRSPAELIGFSNKYFYKPKGKALIPLNHTYLTFEETNRLMLLHQVQSDVNEEFADRVNVAEARKILETFQRLRANSLYANKSVGILSFFNAQATYIRKLFQEAGLEEDHDNYKVSIVEGIQGDEKDILLYSFVLRSPQDKKRYQPLTGEGGDVIGDINRGRVNVAFSRARLQTHCFLSLPLSEVPEKIWIKKYLQYVTDFGDISHRLTDLNPFDSFFEEEFYAYTKATLGSGYRIQNQVKSCGFKIDFVIANTKTASQIAVECDGPTHFKDEIDEEYGIHVEDDEERQRVLEAAGWRFCRIKYSDWIKSGGDKYALEEIIDMLA